MHLHGYKMEILEIFSPERTDCTLAKCSLPDIFDSEEKIHELDDIPAGTRPIKDTFIMPAGGAVATRITTGKPAPWLAHCHMEVHREDGMAFILNVGNYFPQSDDSWLPDDFPDCNTAFLKSHSHEEPHCDCYIDEDAVLGLTLDPTYKCSRSYLCMYEQSQIATLTRDNNLGGFEIQSKTSFPGWAISLIILGIVILITVFITMLPKSERPYKPALVKSFKTTVTRISMLSIRTSESDVKPTFWHQFQGLFFSQWYEYRPGTVNVLRVIEVAGLGILGGVLFQDVGNNSSATGFGEKTSLLFFSTTLWSQTRMYPTIGNYFEWKRKDYLVFKHKQYDWFPVLLSRMVVVLACEAWWPFLFVLCAYPLAAMFGHLGTVFTIGFLLALNNCCYIALGAVFGALSPTVSFGMIGATLFAQTTVICAGFFTKLPALVGWIRYISPIYYAFKGIVKSAYKWDDTYKCLKGQSSVGPNECYLEESAAIDDYKQRGINVATFGDPSSSRIHTEIIMLFVLFAGFQLAIFVHSFISHMKGDKVADSDETVMSQEQHNNVFDEEIVSLGRQSLFLSVDTKMVDLRSISGQNSVSGITSAIQPSIVRNTASTEPRTNSNSVGKSVKFKRDDDEDNIEDDEDNTSSKRSKYIEEFLENDVYDLSQEGYTTA
jgi:hypothetical protein